VVAFLMLPYGLRWWKEREANGNGDRHHRPHGGGGPGSLRSSSKRRVAWRNNNNGGAGGGGGGGSGESMRRRGNGRNLSWSRTDSRTSQRSARVVSMASSNRYRDAAAGPASSGSPLPSRRAQAMSADESHSNYRHTDAATPEHQDAGPPYLSGTFDLSKGTRKSKLPSNSRTSDL
jgi:hypothetical protein